MRKINVNGVTREMTAGENAEYTRMLAEMPVEELTPEERITELEQALEMLLSGVTE